MGMMRLSVSVVAILIAIFSRILADEFKAWLPWLTERAVGRAVDRLPVNQRERFAEEWRSHINDTPGEIAKFMVALGCCLAARKISTSVRSGEGSRRSDVLRRIFDVSFAGPLFILFVPFMLATWIAIKLEELNGPVLLQRHCVGLNGRTFAMLAFRTCTRRPLQTEGDTIAGGARADTSPERLRVTRVGRVIRFTGFAYLPAFVNVLRGEMAVVGPSPLSVRLTEQLAAKTTNFQNRSKVKPGLTGWAQLNSIGTDLESDDTFSRMVAMDFYYVEHRSLRLDMEILLRTFVRPLLGDAWRRRSRN